MSCEDGTAGDSTMMADLIDRSTKDWVKRGVECPSSIESTEPSPYPRLGSSVVMCDHARDAFNVSRVHIDSSVKMNTPTCFSLKKKGGHFFCHFETSHAVCSFPWSKFLFRTPFSTLRRSSDLPRWLLILGFCLSSGQSFSKICFENIDLSLEIQHF